MNIDDGRVLASSGAMLAEGSFEFEGEEASGFMSAPDGLIAVRNGHGRHSTQFELLAGARRDPDGLWTAGTGVHALALQSPIPPLDRLLEYPSFGFVSEGVLSTATRFDLSTEHSGFAWVGVDTVFDPERRRESLLGMAPSGSLAVKRDAHGFEFLIEARVPEPKRGQVASAPFTVRVRATLSFATLALAGSPMWWRGGPERWSVPAADQTGPLADVLTLERSGGTPFFRGLLDLGEAQPDYSRGPWVRAWLSENRLRLVPQREMQGSRGFVQGNNYGPDLIFENLGTAAWKAMLADADEAVLELRGAGIGHVQGVTGRDAYDEGPHEQPITSAQIRLKRTDEGLRIAFDGELGELRQTPRQAPLGPEIHGDFFVPAAFFFARGITLRDQWGERQKRLGKG